MDLLPESRLRIAKNVKRYVFTLEGKTYTIQMCQVWCASCGEPGGWVPEDLLTCDYSHFECQECSEKLGPLIGHYKTPNEMFWEEVKAVQLEQFGRELTAEEQVEALKDSTHPLAKLVSKREDYLKRGRT